jgi:eukaryotic-like serine/threonine-protein kinase
VDLAPGARVDRFVLIEPLGEGGQGSVWKARDPLDPDHPRALKLVRLLHSKPSDVERIRREARSLARLNHPSLVACHGLFEDVRHELLGLTMDFVDGTALGELRADPRLSPELTVAALGHIARALAYVHEHGVVHRDLKLENVLVSHAFWNAPNEAKNVKLVDFGIAAAEGNPEPLTALDSVIGTLPYLAPELIDPTYFGKHSSTPALDVFAFGVLAWKLLFGSEHPTGLGPRASLVEYGVQYRRAAELQGAWPETPGSGAWAALVADCLRALAAERIQNGAELVARVEQAGPAPAVVFAEKPVSRAGGELTAVDSPDAMRGKTAEVDAAAESKLADAPVAGAEARARAERSTARLLPEASAEPTRAASQLTPPRASRWPLVITGALVMAAVGAGAAWMALHSQPVAPPLPATPPASSSSKAAPLVLAPLPAHDAGDASTDAAREAGARPADCAPDASLCACCPSGRDCGSGSCQDDLDPAAGFRLRVGRVLSGGHPLEQTRPDAELCARVIGESHDWNCTPLGAQQDAGPSGRLYVEADDLTVRGLSIMIRDASAPNVPLATRNVVRWNNGLTRRELCSGLSIEGLVGPLEVDSVRLFLDPDPPAGAVLHCPGY